MILTNKNYLNQKIYSSVVWIKHISIDALVSPADYRKMWTHEPLFANYLTTRFCSTTRLRPCRHIFMDSWTRCLITAAQRTKSSRGDSLRQCPWADLWASSEMGECERLRLAPNHVLMIFFTNLLFQACYTAFFWSKFAYRYVQSLKIKLLRWFHFEIWLIYITYK